VEGEQPGYEISDFAFEEMTQNPHRFLHILYPLCNARQLSTAKMKNTLENLLILIKIYKIS
jgi:hypothetical protein